MRFLLAFAPFSVVSKSRASTSPGPTRRWRVAGTRSSAATLPTATATRSSNSPNPHCSARATALGHLALLITQSLQNAFPATTPAIRLLATARRAIPCGAPIATTAWRATRLRCRASKAHDRLTCLGLLLVSLAPPLPALFAEATALTWSSEQRTSSPVGRYIANEPPYER